jgi:peptidoglycan/LPS O-acetylase OafA/YrhL
LKAKRFKNNFDFLRFIFALLVIISHSFALLGIAKQEWLLNLTNNQLSFSGIGLAGFFTISGYFIYKSLARSKSIWAYLKKRILRLFPALLVLLILSILVIPFVYNGEMPLLKNQSYWSYLPRNLSLYGFQGSVNGLFTSLPYRSFNGSLWTIRYEFSLYLFVLLFYFISRKKIKVVILSSLILVTWFVFYQFGMENYGDSKLLGIQGFYLFNLGGFFITGLFFAAVDFKYFKNKALLILGILLILAALYFDLYDHVKHVLFPYVILALGFNAIPKISSFGKYGDPSYGIYIYAFPIQQLLVYYLKPGLLTLLLWSSVAAIIFGYLSWHLIEEKALRFKQ